MSRAKASSPLDVGKLRKISPEPSARAVTLFVCSLSRAKGNVRLNQREFNPEVAQRISSAFRKVLIRDYVMNRGGLHNLA